MSDKGEMVEATGLTKRYGKVRALDGLTFTLGAGEIVALLGPNGAGKTTTFKCLLGVTGFDGGVEVNGISVTSNGKEVRGGGPGSGWSEYPSRSKAGCRRAGCPPVCDSALPWQRRSCPTRRSCC